MGNPLTPAWRTRSFGAPTGIVMAGDLPIVTLQYHNPQTGETAESTAPAPCSPALVRAIGAAFAARGFLRVEES